MSSEVDIIIVGAGSAGLSAAKQAARHGLSCTVVEASHRIGGRAYSEEIAPGVFFDLGCSYLHQAETNPFGPIADELDFTLARDYGDIFTPEAIQVWRNGEQLTGSAADDLWAYDAACDEAVAKAAAEGRDVALAEVIDLTSEHAPGYLAGMASLQAADADLISTADAASFTDGPDWPIREGYGSLVALWGADVPVTLNNQVQKIAWDGNGVSVETAKGTLRGWTALITTSTGVLAAGDIAFDPGLPDWKLDAIAGLPTGCMNKIAVHFDRDLFGPDGRGFYGVEDGDSEPSGFEVSVFGDPLIVVFIGGRFAEWLERQGQDAAQDYALTQIASVFGAGVKDHVTRSIFTVWKGDPWTHGSYTCALPGQAHQRRELARDIDGRVFFAGEATIPGSHATCHGAYLSGIRAVGEIAAALGAPSDQLTG